MAYNINPQPQTYNSTFGGIPGPVGLPNPFQDLASAYPNLGGTNQQLSTDIFAQLSGQLSPGTQQRIQDASAAWGVGSGMPGSQMSKFKGLRDLGLTAEGQVQAGENAYRGIIPSVSATQTVNPNLQADIAAHNAALNAAPNPQQAQSYAKQLFDQYLAQLRGPGGGTSTATSPAGSPGGTPYAPPPKPDTGGPITDSDMWYTPAQTTSSLDSLPSNIYDMPSSALDDFSAYV